MKKLILIAVLLFTTSQIAFAQQAIAKIKFNEAEEAYNAKDYTTAITKLDEVEVLLKSTNPKVMYLRIMAQSKKIEENYLLLDFKTVDLSKKLAAKYLKQYENLPDNEDKYLDIYKTAEMMKKYPKTEVEFNLYMEKLQKEFFAKRDKELNDYGIKLKNMSNYDSELIDVNGKRVTLNSVLNNHTGKSILLIFWDSPNQWNWQFVPKWKKFQTENPNIDFVYVTKGFIESAWKRGYEENEIKNEKYSVANYREFITGAELVDTIPCYILVDKNGKIVLHGRYKTDYIGVQLGFLTQEEFLISKEEEFQNKKK